MKTWIGAVALLALAGCANHPLDCSMGMARDDCLPGTNGYANRQESLNNLAAAKQLQAAKDDAQCQSYGATPGSDAYVNCRVQLDKTATNLQAQTEKERRQNIRSFPRSAWECRPARSASAFEVVTQSVTGCIPTRSGGTIGCRRSLVLPIFKPRQLRLFADAEHELRAETHPR